MNCRISVIMPVYNESRVELTNSIYAILHQSLRPFELIIVDDNPSSILIKKFLLQFRSDKKIKLIFNKINMGAGKSRNIGIKNASGSLLAFTDADDLSDKDRLKDQYLFLHNNNLDFVFSNSRESNEHGRITRKKYYNSSSIISQNKIRFVLSHCSNMANQSTWLLDRRVINKIHGYRDLIVEDFDFVLRALLSNCRLGYQSKVLITRVVRTTSITQNNYLKQYLVAKIIRTYFNKHKGMMPLTSISNVLAHNFSNNEKINFQQFLDYGHNLKIHLNFKNIIYFLKSIFKSKNALPYLIDRLCINLNQIFMGISISKQD